jgi:hypothetical protein
MCCKLRVKFLMVNFDFKALTRIYLHAHNDTLIYADAIDVVLSLSCSCKQLTTANLQKIEENPF